MDKANRYLAEIDSALNEWLENLPSHRMSFRVSRFHSTDSIQVKSDRYPPQDVNLYYQSTVLRACYYMTIIFAHRSFISSPSDPVDTNSPSLALCTNAARQCTRVAHTFLQRHPEMASQWFFMTAINAGINLMLNLSLADQQPRGTDRRSSVQDIQHCAEILRACSRR